jgi:hypothetical protein
MIFALFSTFFFAAVNANSLFLDAANAGIHFGDNNECTIYLNGGSLESTCVIETPVDVEGTCKEKLAAGATTSDVYTVKLPATSAWDNAEKELQDVYCDMETNGGGWMLLLNQIHPDNDFTGSVVPFKQNVNEASPSTTSTYARDWSASQTSLKVNVGDQIMIMDNTLGDWAQMTVAEWCTDQSWFNDATSACGGVGGHPGYANGDILTNDGTTETGRNFHGCSNVGGCADGGADAVGFSTHSQWSDGPSGCYGGCYDHNGGAEFFWKGTSRGHAGPFSVWYREG